MRTKIEIIKKDDFIDGCVFDEDTQELCPLAMKMKDNNNRFDKLKEKMESTELNTCLISQSNKSSLSDKEEMKKNIRSGVASEISYF